MKKEHKLAFLSIHSSPFSQPGIGDTGGMSIYIRELSKQLVKFGCSVDIFTRCNDPQLPEFEVITSRLRIINIQAGKPEAVDKLLIYSYVPDLACQIANYCRQNELHYDIIFSHYWISGICGLYLKTWWQIPHLIMFHTLGAVKNAIGIGEDEPDLRIEEEKLLTRECDRIIASTRKELDFLNLYYGTNSEKVSIVPCGVNMDLFKPMEKAMARKLAGINNAEDRLVLFAGRIERLKGLDQLIKAIALLRNKHLRLLVVGEDGNRRGEVDHLKSLATQLGIADLVSFPGLIEYEKLPLYYNAADVCVFPSYYESFGLVPLESLACGTPVVATPVGNLPKIIIPDLNGYVVPDNSAENLAVKINQIISHPHDWSKKQFLIRESVLEYNWNHIARSLLRIFDNISSLNPIKT